MLSTKNAPIIMKITTMKKINANIQSKLLPILLKLLALFVASLLASPPKLEKPEELNILLNNLMPKKVSIKTTAITEIITMNVTIDGMSPFLFNFKVIFFSLAFLSLK